jgi:uncharacterized membrane protein
MEENSQTPEIVTSPSVETTGEEYAPSSTEKKRAVMMYLLIGIIVVALNNQKKNAFELFHLKQSLGWRSVFLLLMIASAIFMFLPIIKYLPIFVVLVMIVFLGVFIKRARDGKYTIAQENKLSIFVSLGGWIMDLFEIKEEIKPEIKPEVQQEQKPETNS